MKNSGLIEEVKKFQFLQGLIKTQQFATSQGNEVKFQFLQGLIKTKFRAWQKKRKTMVSIPTRSD